MVSAAVSLLVVAVARCRRRPTFVHLSMYLYLGRERSLAPHLSGAWLPYSRATQPTIATSIKPPFAIATSTRKSAANAWLQRRRLREIPKQRNNERELHLSFSCSEPHVHARIQHIHTSSIPARSLSLSLSRARQLYLALQRFQPISQQQRRVSGETRCAERSRVIDRSPSHSLHSLSFALALALPNSKPNSTAITRTGEKSSTSFDLSAIACYAPYSRGGA